MTSLIAQPDAADIGLDLGDAAATLGVEDLRELMRALNETTRNLEETHVSLRAEVTRLNGELAEANAQLRRSKALAALGEMAAGIAHEIRNPIASIQLYVQMLAEDLDDRRDEADLCAKIGRAVTGLDAIVRDVLAFSRDTSCRFEATSATTLVDGALTACEALIEQSGVEITRQLPDNGAAFLEADPILVTQAIGNVVRNAIEAMTETACDLRRLTVSVDRKPVRCPGGRRRTRVIVAVEDTGPGIPADVVQRMFNPFFTTRKTGTGLGLAIVHRIIDAHGGHVSVRNATGGGARVELCLPTRAETREPDDEALRSVEPPLVETTRNPGATPHLSGVGSPPHHSKEA